jgi:hypothetical protein
VDINERAKRYTGNVVRKPYGTGSKSERSAVMLSTRWGDFVLRRRDPQSLVDPELDKLVGKRIRVRGVIHRHTLTMLEWEEVP